MFRAGAVATGVNLGVEIMLGFLGAALPIVGDLIGGGDKGAKPEASGDGGGGGFDIGGLFSGALDLLGGGGLFSAIGGLFGGGGGGFDLGGLFGGGGGGRGGLFGIGGDDGGGGLFGLF
jgi:hypothetical protein